MSAFALVSICTESLTVLPATGQSLRSMDPKVTYVCGKQLPCRDHPRDAERRYVRQNEGTE